LNPFAGINLAGVEVTVRVYGGNVQPVELTSIVSIEILLPGRRNWKDAAGRSLVSEKRDVNARRGILYHRETSTLGPSLSFSPHAQTRMDIGDCALGVRIEPIHACFGRSPRRNRIARAD
jgi:hypothetical protein